MFDLPKRLSRLNAAAGASARQTQRVHLIFVLSCAYVALMLAATTHAHLLRDGGIDMPVLNVSVPIFWFCLAVPWLLVLLHCHLLLQIKLLASTLSALELGVIELQTAGQQREQRELIYPSLIAQVLLGNHTRGWVVQLARALVAVTVCVLPVVLLLWALLLFVPYHDAGATWLQRLALFADLALLWFVWGGILRERPGRHRRVVTGRWQAYVGPVTKAAVVVAVCSAALVVAVVPGERIEVLRRPKLQRIFRVTDHWFPRSLDLAGHTLVATPPAAELIAAYQPRGQDADVAWREHAPGLDLRGRDLRMGNFANARLENADLRNAKLEGANFQGAVLRGAVFTDTIPGDADATPGGGDGVPRATGGRAQLQGVILRYAELQDADLDGAELHGADLSGAHLQGAVMNRAVLRGATLTRADLEGVGLVLADLTGADLRRASLQGASLAQADLRGADLSDADLRGADLHGAKLDGASLQAVQLRGADLRNASLRDACFRASDLSLSDLRGAQLAPLSEEDRAGLLYEVAAHLIDDASDAPAENLSEQEIVARLTSSRSAPWMTDLLERMRAALTQSCPPLSPDAVITTGAIYDRTGALADWPIPPEKAAHSRELSNYLAELACTNTRLAKSLVWQYDPAQSRFGLKPALQENLSTLPVELLERRCPATAQLPDDIRVALEGARDHQPQASPARITQVSATSSTAPTRARGKRRR